MNYLRASIIKKASTQVTKKVKDKTRFVSSRIGSAMLYDILQDIDNLDRDSRSLQEAKDLENITYLNPAYYYKKYNSNYSRAGNEIPLSERDRLIRSALYQVMQVFDTVRYAANKVQGNKVANLLLGRIFKDTVVTNVVFYVSTQLYVYSEIFKSSKSSDMKAIIEKVYKTREKWITGLSTKYMRIQMTKITQQNPYAVYFELWSYYKRPGRDKGYYNRAMDFGVYTSGGTAMAGIRSKDDLPTLNELYGWFKRREAAGLYRPMVAVGWRSRRKYGLSYKEPKNWLLKPYAAAYLTWIRMQRRFKKRGKLAPFGSFAKYNKRNTVYQTTIFTEIFNKYMAYVLKRVKVEKAEIIEKTEDNFKFKVDRLIRSMNKNLKRTDRDLRSLNYLIRTKNIKDISSVAVQSQYQVTDLKKLVRLAKKLEIKV